MSGYDPEGLADVYITTAGGTKSGRARVLWRMSIADAMAVCSDPSTAGRGQWGEWMMCWTAHRLIDDDGFVFDDGRFEALFQRLGVTVLRSRHMIRCGEAPTLISHEPAPVIRLGGRSARQLPLFDNLNAA